MFFDKRVRQTVGALVFYCFFLWLSLTALANNNFCISHDDQQTLFCLDFEDKSIGTYNAENLNKDWPNLSSLSTKLPIYSWGVSQQRVSIVEKTDLRVSNKTNKAMRISYPEEKFGPWQTGATWQMKLPKYLNQKPYEALTLEYKVLFKEGFLYARDGLFGGKLPGLMGGETISGGKTSTGKNGWTARLMWGQKGRGLGYLYYPDMKSDEHNKQACPRHGQASEDCVIYRNKYFTFDTNSKRKCLSEWAAYPYEFRFKTERFYKIKQFIKMNTLSEGNSEGNRDGILRIWVDDTLMLNCTNIRYRDIPELAIDSILFSTFFGGNTPKVQLTPTMSLFILMIF